MGLRVSLPCMTCSTHYRSPSLENTERPKSLRLLQVSHPCQPPRPQLCTANFLPLHQGSYFLPVYPACGPYLRGSARSLPHSLPFTDHHSHCTWVTSLCTDLTLTMCPSCFLEPQLLSLFNGLFLPTPPISLKHTYPNNPSK